MELVQLPFWFQAVFSIAMGLICGSFTNVIVARLPQGKSVVTPRSCCIKCKKAIAWYDNIPVLSFLFLRGKCRSCGVKISMRYPIIELLVALLFLVTMLRFGFSPLLILRDWPLMVILVAITFIDLEHRIIPDVLSLGGLVLGLLTSFWEPRYGWTTAALGAGLGFGVFYGFAWLYHRITGRHGLGGGDIKLLAMVGAFTGPAGVLTTVLMSSIAGSVIGIAWAAFSKQGSLLKVSIPYGPFLVLGVLYAYLLGDLLWLPFMIQT